MCHIVDGCMTMLGNANSMKPRRIMQDDGIEVLANVFMAKGLKSGIQYAPFGCTEGLKLAKEHPDLIINDDKA